MGHDDDETGGSGPLIEEAVSPRLIARAEPPAPAEGAEGELAEGEGGDDAWPRYKTMVIEAGMSLNRVFYPAAVLEASIKLLEGKPVYIEHSEPGDIFGFEGRSIRSKVGWWSDAKFEKVDGTAGIVATMNLYNSSPEPWLAARIEEALARERQEDIGVSIAARAKTDYKKDEEGVYREVQEILEYRSADVVGEPAAGGRPLRIAASIGKDEAVDKIESATSFAELLEADPSMTLEKAKELRPDLFETKAEETEEEEETTETTETTDPPKPTETLTEKKKNKPTGEPSTGPSISEVVESQTLLNAQVSAIAAAQAKQYLDAKLAEAKLPKALEEMAREKAKDLVDPMKIDEVVDDFVKIHKASVESAPAPTGAPSIAFPMMGVSANSTVTPLDRVVASMDRFFGAEKFLSADGKTEIEESELFRVGSLQQLYHMLTGVAPTEAQGWGIHEGGLLYEAVNAPIPGANTVGFGGPATYLPNLPAAPASLVSLPGIFGISMNRAKGDIYRGQMRWWEPIVSYKDINNMKEQEYVQADDFPVMPIREELQDYAVVRQGDNVERWMPAERGHMAQVSRLSIINDDLDAFRDIPMRFAKSATRTINEYVAGLFTAGSGAGRNLSDGNAVMHSSHGGNVGASALSRASLTTGIQAIEEQEDTAGGRLDLTAEFLLVPNRLRPTAHELLASARVPDNANNAVNWLNSYGIERTINVPNWSDVNNWYLMAGPSQITSIQLGFLGGRRVPDFIAQTSPTEGLNYTHDVMSWKQRWDFGGDFVEYRGVYGAIVT